MSMIKLDNVSRVYLLNTQQVAALMHVTAELGKGDFCAIVGPSGSGKSTLLNVLGLLDRPSHGQYRLNGIDTHLLNGVERARLRNQSIGFVFQHFRLISSLNVLENVCIPYLYGNWKRQAIQARAKELLTEMGLKSRLEHKPEQLSGGERQRVAIARALVTRPAILLADEPTAALDSDNSHLVIECLKNAQLNMQTTVVLVTHDEKLAEDCDTRIHMREGKIQRIETYNCAV